MGEPVSSIGVTFVISKALTAIAGFFGGLSVSFFWQPKKLNQHGKLAAGAIIGGISVAASFTLGGIIARETGLDFTDADVALGVGYTVGVVSVGIISFLANFFDKREDLDILEVAQELKKSRVLPVKRKPARKTPIKRVPK